MLPRSEGERGAAGPTVAWRRPAKSGPRTPLVVFLHGRGADEYDLLDLADALPRGYAFASVRAPIPMEGGGWTWFESSAVARPVAESLRASTDALRAWLDDPAQPYGRERCYLLGFSAGMMMASSLVLDDPARFAGAVLLSGAIPFGAGVPTDDERLKGVPIFHGHGTLDPIIPKPLVEKTERYLRERSGAILTDRRYPIAHSISEPELTDIASWFDELAAP